MKRISSPSRTSAVTTSLRVDESLLRETSRAPRLKATMGERRTKELAENTTRLQAQAYIDAFDGGEPCPPHIYLAMRMTKEEKAGARRAGLAEALPCADCHQRVLKHWRLAYYLKYGIGDAIPPRALQLRELMRRNKNVTAGASFGKGDMPETEAGKAAAAATLKEYAGVIVVE